MIGWLCKGYLVAIEAHKATIEVLRSENQRLRDMNTRLVGMIAEPSAPQMDLPMQLEPQLPEVVTHAINSVAAPQEKELRRHLHEYATGALITGQEADAIAESIRAGTDVDEIVD